MHAIPLKEGFVAKDNKIIHGTLQHLYFFLSILEVSWLDLERFIVHLCFIDEVLDAGPLLPQARLRKVFRSEVGR